MREEGRLLEALCTRERKKGRDVLSRERERGLYTRLDGEILVDPQEAANVFRPSYIVYRYTHSHGVFELSEAFSLSARD